MSKPCYTIDFETTGKDAAKAHAIEAALASPQDGAYHWESFISLPDGVVIPPETSAVHHIIQEDIEGAPSWDDTVAAILGRITMDELEPEEVVLIAHNAEYERAVLAGTPLGRCLWVCTFKCALIAFPDAPSHSNEALRYWLGLGHRGRAMKQASHSALHDCKVTAGIFNALQGWFYAELCSKGHLDGQTVIHSDTAQDAILAEMIRISGEIAVLPTCPIGKERGKKWPDIETGFLQWCLKQEDMREDVKHAAEGELQRRGAPRASRSRW